MDGPLISDQFEQKNQTYLSLEILQSITVFLLVLTMMKGSWIAVLGAGAPHLLS